MQKNTAAAAFSLVIMLYGASASAGISSNISDALSAAVKPIPPINFNSAAAASVMPANNSCSYAFTQVNQDATSPGALGTISVLVGGVNMASYATQVTWEQFIHRTHELNGNLARLCASLGGVKAQ